MRRYTFPQILGEHLDHGWYPDNPVSTTEPILIVSGPMLCRLQVWTEAQWAVLPEAERPVHYIHAPGLGWVGGIPIGCMN